MAARKNGKGTKGRKAPARRQGKARRRRKNGADGPVIGYLGRTLRTAFYWTAVAGIVGIGLVGAVVAYYASKLPPMADWTVPPRAANVRILASDGQLISNHGDSAGEALKLSQMPAFLPEAVISIEDRRFYWNFGIDPIGLVRAAIVNLKAGHIVEGGSTLTQQLAKNLFLKPQRTIERKIQEMIMAVWLQLHLSKNQILTLYLNRVYFGAGAYGVDAAAHRYFGKSARNITLAEAATLAGMLKAPTSYSPAIHPKASEARMHTVLVAMEESGYITARQASLAMSVPVKAVHDVADGSGRYVVDWIMDRLPQYVGGQIDQDIIVDTTINLHLQTAAANAISKTLAESGKKYGVGEAALVSIAPNGAVKAMVGGRDYKTAPFNRAVNAHRQPGSTFKPFVYLTALEDGMIPETVMVDKPVSIKGWKPSDYERTYRGPVTLQTALADSLNSVAAQVTQIVTPQAVAATARRLGIVSPLLATPSIALGTSEVTPLELTAAYVPFSNGGRGIIPYAIKRIVTASGKVLYQRSGTGPGQVINPVYVGMMNSMLQQTVISGTGRHARIPGWQVAGKTGTSQRFRDAWFIGYTGVLTTGVWFGNDNDSPTRHATGGSLPAITWQRFMSVALKGQAVAALPGNYHFGDPANVRYAERPIYPSDVTAAQATGAPLVLGPGGSGALAAGPQVAQGGPVPPGNVGQRRRQGPITSFLQKLFGG